MPYQRITVSNFRHLLLWDITCKLSISLGDREELQTNNSSLGVPVWASFSGVNLFSAETKRSCILKVYLSSNVNAATCKCCYPPHRSLPLRWMMQILSNFIAYTLRITTSAAFSGTARQDHGRLLTKMFQLGELWKNLTFFQFSLSLALKMCQMLN